MQKRHLDNCCNRPTGRHDRRGSIYIIVVGTSLLVGLLGLSSLLQQQVGRRAHQAAFDSVQARNNASTALRVGMLLIENDSDWRFTFPNGDWEVDVALANGAYTLQGHDPSDSDLTDNPTEPVVLTGVGKYGEVTHKTQITLVPANRGFTCLEAALHSNVDVVIKSNATINNDQLISANRDIDATSATVNGDAEAVSVITGSTYHGSTTSGTTARTMPNVKDVFTYYLANGTVIDKGSLPLGYASVVRNPGFENGTTDWSGLDCTIAAASEEFAGGMASVKVTSRLNHRAGPQQLVTDIIQNGSTYDVHAWVKMDSTANVGTAISLRIDSSVEGVQWFDSIYSDISDVDGWQDLSSSLTPTWTGTLNSAQLYVTTRDGNSVTEFYADDFVLKETGSDRTIHNQVLSPDNNPFGSTTNPRGIYVINLSNEKVFIKNSRIVGTLVLINPNAGSEIGGGSAINWEPAVPGYPALLVDNEDVTINPGNGGLNESASQINFNPLGTPYQGDADADQTDTYASEIKGLIYGTKKVKLKNQPVITGAIIAHDEIEISDTLNLTWNSTYLTNPPPGFQDSDSVRILLGSAGRAID
jgi:hypothetical protein